MFIYKKFKYKCKDFNIKKKKNKSKMHIVIFKKLFKIFLS